MKIYATRNKSEHPFDTILGKDLWIKVGWDDIPAYWVKVLNKRIGYHGDPIYDIIRITPDDVMLSRQSEDGMDSFQELMQTVDKGVGEHHFDIIYPIDVISTAELLEETPQEYSRETRGFI